MRDTSKAERTATIDALFGQICRSTPPEALALSMVLTDVERAEVALSCYGRAHLREQGRSIAAACTRESLFRAGGQAGLALHAAINAAGDTWGGILRPEKRRISLAGQAEIRAAC